MSSKDILIDIEYILNLIWFVIWSILLFVGLLEYFNVDLDLLIGSPQRLFFRKLTLITILFVWIVQFVGNLSLLYIKLNNKLIIDQIIFILNSFPTILNFYLGYYYCEMKIIGYTGKLCNNSSISPKLYDKLLNRFNLLKTDLNFKLKLIILLIFLGFILSSLLKRIIFILLAVFGYFLYSSTMKQWYLHLKYLKIMLNKDKKYNVKIMGSKNKENCSHKKNKQKIYNLLKTDLKRFYFLFIWYLSITISQTIYAILILSIHNEKKFNKMPPEFKHKNRNMCDIIFTFIIITLENIFYLIEIIILLYIDFLESNVLCCIYYFITCNYIKFKNYLYEIFILDKIKSKQLKKERYFKRLDNNNNTLKEIWPLPKLMINNKNALNKLNQQIKKHSQSQLNKEEKSIKSKTKDNNSSSSDEFIQFNRTNTMDSIKEIDIIDDENSSNKLNTIRVITKASLSGSSYIDDISSDITIELDSIDMIDNMSQSYDNHLQQPKLFKTKSNSYSISAFEI